MVSYAKGRPRRVHFLLNCDVISAPGSSSFRAPGQRCGVPSFRPVRMNLSLPVFPGCQQKGFARLLVLVAGRGFEPRRGTQGASRQPIDIGVKERGECASHEVGAVPVLLQRLPCPGFRRVVIP